MAPFVLVEGIKVIDNGLNVGGEGRGLGEGNVDLMEEFGVSVGGEEGGGGWGVHI